MELENRLRCPIREGAPCSGLLIPWEHVDCFALSVEERRINYVRWSVADQNNYELGNVVISPTPWVFSYATSLFRDERMARSMQAVAMSEMVVLALMSFLAAAKNGGHHPRSVGVGINGQPDGQQKVGEGVIVPVGPKMLQLWTDRTVVKLTDGTEFKALALMAVDATRHIDWTSACLLYTSPSPRDA